VPPHAHHPNPGNFANRSHDELAAIGQKDGKKGGKATSGGFHGTNTDKQVGLNLKIDRDILTRVEDIVKRRRRKAAAEHEESELNELEAEQRGRSHEPSVVPPGFEEWKTCA
jgi:hypothetical protein